MPKLTAVIPSRLNSSNGQSHDLPESHREGVFVTGEEGKVFRNDQFLLAYSGTPYFQGESSANDAINEKTARDLVSLFRRDGCGALSRLKGHFALIIFDRQNNQLLAATDRAGVHRLYWHKTEQGNLVISTSLREVRSRCHQGNELSHQAIYSYIYFHMVPTPLSIHPEINKLPPATALTGSPQEVSLQTYWKPPFETRSSAHIDELADQLLQLIEDSTRRSLSESCKNGAFLSGGLDSSTIAGMFAKIAPQQAPTFSIGFNAKAYDETPFARITASHFQTQHNEYFVTPDDVLDSLPNIVKSMDEPFGNSSALPAYYCARLAVDNGITNLLAGDGGDELFAGNKRYATQRKYSYFNAIPPGLRNKLVTPLISTLPDAIPYAGKAKRYATQANIPLPARLQIYNFLNRHPASEIFSSDFLTSVDDSLPQKLQNGIFQQPEQASELDRMLFLDWHITLADNDLRKVSQMCELAGVNVAYPLLSDELIDFSCLIPDDMKLKGQKLRYFYKYAMRNFLPAQTLSKTKHGFGLPFGVWLREYKPLRELAHDTLEKLKARHYFEKGFIDKAFEMHEQQHASYYGELIWLMLVLELWLDS